MIEEEFQPDNVQRPSWMKVIPQREAWLDTRWDYHRQYPEMGFYSYRHARRQLLGEEITTRKLIYLDVKYWIFLRDVMMGRPQKPIHRDIFDVLLRLVFKRKCLCPFSYPIFTEMHKQSDLNSRLMTARVIDLFSESVCLQNPEALTRGEILSFLRRVLPGHGIKIPKRVIVWTKAGFFSGEPMWVNPHIPRELELLTQKVMEDNILEMTVEEMVGACSDGEAPFFLEPPIHEDLNENKRRRAGSVATFQDAYLEEVAATIDSQGEAIYDVFSHLHHEEYGSRPDVPYQPDTPQIQRFKELLYEIIKQNKLPGELPCFHLESAIHAAVFMDRFRKYKANDLFDFEHAAMAMPYYDCFFTETSLCHFVSHPPLSFDKLYGSQVVSREEDVLTLLQSMS